MTPEMQSVLIQLLGALALGIPLTARAVPRALESWTKAKADAKKTAADALRTSAEAEKIEAETAAAALTDLRARLDDCEAKHKVSDRKHDEQREEINGLRRQVDSDALVLERFRTKMEQDEGVIRGMRIELDELRRIVSTGARHHA